ncbi:MAG TPA: ferrous iron transport protein B [Nannocystaceae bacterium]|nr:ferrous iron transport protein B [Nannocystaceae bacterium]
MSERVVRIAVAGNPNVGKTSLFNVLTGSRHQVGNYAGVTVERREGWVTDALAGARSIRLLDLPGTYSLSAISEDEAVAFRVIAGDGAPAPDAVLLVVDATNLARNLYLALQVRELGVPIVVALNMMDVARAHGLPVDAPRLQRLLGVPVIPTTARSGAGAAELVAALVDVEPASALCLAPGGDSRELADALRKLGAVAAPARARWLVTSGAAGTAEEFGARPDELAALAQISAGDLARAAEQLVALRYREVDRMLAELAPEADMRAEARPLALSERIDKVLTHRVWGFTAFIGVMATVFVSIFTWATPVMDAIEGVVGAIADGVQLSVGPGLLGDLLANGVIAGVGNVLVFVPQIALLFLFIGLLEDSGYLARAAFLMDRVMARLGLHGRAFIPLLSGYACAIPAILGTRTISSAKDRLVTILMIPFMSCSARLPIYSLVIGALFVTTTDDWRGDVTRGLVLLAMYGLSTISALFMGWIYKRTILKSPTPPLVLELPPYRMPRLRNTLLVVADRTLDFVRNAGTVILACTIVLWALLSFPREDTGAGGDGPTAIAESYGGKAARAIEPALTPIGQDWRMGVGIIGSFAAREVLVSTLGLVYGLEADDDDPKELREAIRNDTDPATGQRRYTPLTGLALMVFFVYACQCMSTLAVVRRETRSWRWPAFMFVSMTGIAYVAALIVYQGGRLLGF